MEAYLSTVGKYEDPLYVFKSCMRCYVVVLQRMDDTETNEDRANICTPYTAKHRGTVFTVADIINKFTGISDIEKISNSIDNSHIWYIKGEIISSNSPLGNKETVTAPGIYFYQSPEAAWESEMDEIYDGTLREWYDDGKIMMERSYKQGKMHGKYISYADNGQITYLCTYDKGTLHGVLKRWNKCGKITFEGAYTKGKPSGKHINYDYYHKKVYTMIPDDNGNFSGDPTITEMKEEQN